MTKTRVQLATLIALLFCCGGPLFGQTIRLRKEYRAEGSIILLGDVAEITASDRKALAQLSRLELIVTPSRRPRELSVGEIREFMTLNSLKPAMYRFRGSASVTVFPRRGRPIKSTKALNIRGNVVDTAKKIVTKAIVRHLTRRSGQKHDWQVSFMVGKRNAERILKATGQPRVKGGRAPWTGKQRFWIEIATGDSVAQFPVYAQVTPREFVVTTTRAIRRGQRIAAADVELRPAPPQLRGAQVVYHLEDVVGRESRKSLATGQPVDSRSLVKTKLVKRRQLITVYARGPGIMVRMTARSLEDGTKGDLINIESLEGKRRFSARVIGPQEAAIYISPTVVSPKRTGREGSAVRPVSRTGKRTRRSR